MNDLMRKRLDAVHDVRCPICGTKASWVQTSEDGFQTIACHDELLTLIEEREKSFFPSLTDMQKKHTFKNL